MAECDVCTAKLGRTTGMGACDMGIFAANF